LRESTPLPDPDPGEEGGEYGQTAVQEHPAMPAGRKAPPRSQSG
jgi:hypothetical protein